MDARVTITDADRYPTLSEHGRQMLEFLREHPHAPIFRSESGNRLTAADVERVRALEREVNAASVGWRPGEEPPWRRNRSAAWARPSRRRAARLPTRMLQVRLCHADDG